MLRPLSFVGGLDGFSTEIAFVRRIPILAAVAYWRIAPTSFLVLDARTAPEASFAVPVRRENKRIKSYWWLGHE